MKKKELSSEEKVQLLVQPFIKKKDIAAVLDCSVKNAEEIFDKINGYFKECQEIKEDFDVEQFVNRLSTI